MVERRCLCRSEDERRRRRTRCGRSAQASRTARLLHQVATGEGRRAELRRRRTLGKQLFARRRMVRDGYPCSLHRGQRNWHRSCLTLHLRYARATCVLWLTIPGGNVSQPRGTHRHGSDAGIAARNQCAHASYRPRAHRGFVGFAPRGKLSGSSKTFVPTNQAGRARRRARRAAMTASAATPAGGPDLRVSVAGIALKNPVIAASGTFGYGLEFEDVVHLDRLGGFVVKGLSREPMIGNPPPRLWETPAGMLNAIGLQNIGAPAFLQEKLPHLRQIKDAVVFANVFGYTREDYEHTIQILNEGEGIAAYELNVSCPNTQHGGLQFGSDPRTLDEVVTTARRVTNRPLIVKLSPNVTSIAQMAYVAQEAGADAVSLINTFVAMAIDPETRKPRIANVTAGLSGPAIKPIAVRMVYDAAHAVKIPVIGMGGISTAADVVEFMLAGASAVQIGTASYWDPCATEKIVDELDEWCKEHHVSRIADLIGGMQME